MRRPIIKKGIILIAKPTLLADVFHRSVILITEHSDTGSIGFVLNKSLGLPVRDFLSDLNANQMVFEGGPVDQENIFYIHKRPDLIEDSVRIKDGLYWSGSFEDVLFNINNGLIKPDEIRFYLGYSGWAGNQLDAEIENNAWHVLDKTDFDIFKEWDINLWQKKMQDLGGENLLWYNMPENPALN
ncbi:MAG: YqgE/AlgH family protein [Weeksellaceae bacterium]